MGPEPGVRYVFYIYLCSTGTNGLTCLNPAFPLDIYKRMTIPNEYTGLATDLDSEPKTLMEEKDPETSIEPSSHELVHFKRNADETDLVAVPWQTLWLLQATKPNCGFQDVITHLGDYRRDLQDSDWLQNQPEEYIGQCPVKFRSHVDPSRWLPHNLVVSECLCEGSPCARRGRHICITVYTARSIYRFQSGKKRVFIAVGCMCAIKKTRMANIVQPTSVD